MDTIEQNKLLEEMISDTDFKQNTLQEISTRATSALTESNWSSETWTPTSVTTENSTLLWNTTTTESPSPPVLDLITILSLYSHYRWSRYLGIYTNPVLIVLGTIGNFLSFLVMTRKSMIKSSTFYYMAALAVADTLVLYFGCLRTWLAYLNGYDAIILSPAACKTFSFMSYWSFDIAAWILVAMTIDRFLAIHYPLKVAKYATTKRARKTIITIIVIFAGINAHFFFILTINSRGSCTALDEHKNFFNLVWPWLDATVYSFLPFIILVIFNSLIIYDHHKAVIRRSSLQPNMVSGSNIQPFYRNYANRRLTIMLLMVSISFLITSSPKTILIIIRPYAFNVLDGGTGINFPLLATYTLTSSIANLLIYTNHSLNFLLYCMSGLRFRTELKHIFLRCISPHGTRRISTTSALIENMRRNSMNAGKNNEHMIDISENVIECTPL
ncbi:hypothetical protein SNE40_012335 [Patella caerulea]|uniref:G-protein coupled receptors family 1 profile domain-containing protein n=1 Tax=Patella caerulea TaxID=87958 RepID=A0AAN8JP80_PATCE